jgi:hypothetical protein
MTQYCDAAGGGAVASSYGDIAFTDRPSVMDAGASCGQGFVISPLDGYSIVNGHEYPETVTDQAPCRLPIGEVSAHGPRRRCAP